MKVTDTDFCNVICIHNNKGVCNTMKRVPLNQGDKINLNNREYTIDTVIGDGATCIVYCVFCLL